MNFKLISSIILIGILLIFVIQNATVVEVKLFFWSIEISRALLMFIVFSVGIIIGWFANSVLNFQREEE